MSSQQVISLINLYHYRNFDKSINIMHNNIIQYVSLLFCLLELNLLPFSLCLTQTPFTFGLNQRAPYTAGDRCLLCRCERKDSAVPSEMGTPGLNGTGQPSPTPSALQLPLWVCSDCRRTVEKEDRHAAMEQSVGVSRVATSHHVYMPSSIKLY